jgi:phage baseplate assembly protein W
MAFGAQKISPIDFNKSAAVGVDLPFSAPSVFYQNYTTAAAIKNNLINYFLTNPGERPLNPEFGGGLRAFIFEQITSDNLDGLKEKIQNDLENFFTNINVIDLQVNGFEDRNTINTILKYSVNQTNIVDTVEMNFE